MAIGRWTARTWFRVAIGAAGLFAVVLTGLMFTSTRDLHRVRQELHAEVAVPGTVTVELPEGRAQVWAIAASTDDLPEDARKVDLEVTLTGSDGTEVRLTDPGNRVVYGDQDGGGALAEVATGSIPEAGRYRLTVAEVPGVVGGTRAGIGPDISFAPMAPWMLALFASFAAVLGGLQRGARVRRAERDEARATLGG